MSCIEDVFKAINVKERHSGYPGKEWKVIITFSSNEWRPALRWFEKNTKRPETKTKIRAAHLYRAGDHTWLAYAERSTSAAEREAYVNNQKPREFTPPPYLFRG